MHSSTSGGVNTYQMSCRPREPLAALIMRLTSAWTWASVMHVAVFWGEAHCSDFDG